MPHAKAQLFSWPGLASVVLNLDDPFGQRLEQPDPTAARVAGYGFQRGAVVGEKLRLSQAGLHLRPCTPTGAMPKSMRRCWAASMPPTCWPC